MSTAKSRQGGGGAGMTVRQFPVGPRRRYVPVVDGGCGCRPPRRPRLLGLPSWFLNSGSCGGTTTTATTAVKSGGGGARSRYSSSSRTSTASLSSSSYAATHSSMGYSSSDYRKSERQARKKKQVVTNKSVAADDEDGNGVGVAVEKESSDPRADFRDSMVQMVVETGMCDWDGLRCMLRRLLALNAPRHHAAILTAFAEVCAQIVAAQSPSPSPHPSPSLAPYHQR